MFIEPYSTLAKQPVETKMAILSYGTELSEIRPQCIHPDYDYKHFYDIFSCPKVRMNVKVSKSLLLLFLLSMLLFLWYCGVYVAVVVSLG